MPAIPDSDAMNVVLVHGAWADGSGWEGVYRLLRKKGFSVSVVQHPTISLTDDVEAVRQVLATQNGPVILVGHSYGGAVITEAGNDPKVVGLVYVAAFAPEANESINDLGKGQPPPPWASQLQVDSGGFARLPAETVSKDFAQDL